MVAGARRPSSTRPPSHADITQLNDADLERMILMLGHEIDKADPQLLTLSPVPTNGCGD